VDYVATLGVEEGGPWTPEAGAPTLPEASDVDRALPPLPNDGGEDADVGDGCQVVAVRGLATDQVIPPSTSGWIDPDGARSPGGGKAASSANTASYSGDLSVRRFELDIPEGATIEGVQVTIVRQANRASAVRDEVVSIQGKGGAIGGNRADTSTSWPTALEPHDYGSLTDTWGASAAELSPGVLGANDFRVVIRARLSGQGGSPATASIDDVVVRVAYCK